MSLKDKYSFESLKDLSGDEIGKKLTSGEFSVPAEDHEKFMEFAQAEPGSEARLKILSGTTEPEPPVEPVEDKPKDADPAKPLPVDKDADPLKTEEKPLEDAEAAKDNSELLNKLDAIRKERDSQRAANRRIGNELKQRDQELEDLRKQLEEVKKAQAKQTVELKAPIPPDPKDFEDGHLGDDYQEATSKWAADWKEYTEKSGEVPPKWAQAIFDKLDDTYKKAESAYNFVNSKQQEETETSTVNAWNEMWEHTEDLQKKLNLDTGKLTPKTINYYVLRAENEPDAKGNKPYSESEQSEAKAFLKEIPKEHIANFGKLSKLITSYYRFDDGIPQKAYDLSDKAVIPELIQKLGLDVNPVVPLDSDVTGDLSKKQIKDSELESATPSQELGGPTDKLSDNMSTDERMEKFIQMSETYRMNPRKCEANPEFMAQFTALQQEASQIVNQ